METCQLCHAPVDSVARFPASQIRCAIEAGLRPVTPADDAGTSGPKDTLLNTWVRVAMTQSTDWLFCASCAARSESYLELAGFWRGTLYAVRNPDHSETECLELPLDLPPGTKYWTYEVTGLMPYPLPRGVVTEPAARAKQLRAQGFTFRNTTPLGGHIVSASSGRTGAERATPPRSNARGVTDDPARGRVWQRLTRWLTG